MRQRGFTLLEIIVAVAILAMGIGTAMQIFSGGMNNVRRIDLAHRAMDHAENVMSEILSDRNIVGPIQLGGDLDEDFRFTVSVDYWDPPRHNPLPIDVTQNRIDLLSVLVEIHFKNDRRGKMYRAVSLKAVSLEPEPSPTGPGVDPIRQLFGRGN